jgi:hypothetical protein
MSNEETSPPAPLQRERGVDNFISPKHSDIFMGRHNNVPPFALLRENKYNEI